MIDKIKDIRNNPEILDTILIGGGTLLGSFFSYLLQFVLGRKLSVEDYGNFNVLLSLSSIIGVFATVFGISQIKVVSEFFVKKESLKISSLLKWVSKFSVILGIVIFLLISLLSKYISVSLNMTDSLTIFLFAFLLGLGFVNTIPTSFMQGMQEFKKYSLFQIIYLFTRFLLPVIFIYMGLGLRGVFIGLPLSSIFALILGFGMLGISFKGAEKLDLASRSKKLVLFGLSFLIVNFCMTALVNVDLIMVKKYFSPLDAGYYAGAVTLGKVLLFGASAVSVIMFPKITALYSGGEYFLRKLKRLFLLLVGILSLGVICYWLIPGVLTHTFFGKSFDNSIQFLPLFSIFVSLYVLVNFFVLFFLAVDKNKVGFLLIPGLLAQYILLNVFHESVFDVIKVNIGVCILTLGLLSVYFYKSIPGLRAIRKEDRVGE